MCQLARWAWNHQSSQRSSARRRSHFSRFSRYRINMWWLSRPFKRGCKPIISLIWCQRLNKLDLYDVGCELHLFKLNGEQSWSFSFICFFSSKLQVNRTKSRIPRRQCGSRFNQTPFFSQVKTKTPSAGQMWPLLPQKLGRELVLPAGGAKTLSCWGTFHRPGKRFKLLCAYFHRSIDGTHGNPFSEVHIFPRKRNHEVVLPKLHKKCV